MNILKGHKEEIIRRGYTGHVTSFEGYIQFNHIYDISHNIIGYTAEYFQKCIELIQSPEYLYARQKEGYINLYKKDDTSPTGVSLLGGIPNEFEFLLKALGKTSQLSPTEDLRTAH